MADISGNAEAMKAEAMRREEEEARMKQAFEEVSDRPYVSGHSMLLASTGFAGVLGPKKDKKINHNSIF